MELRFKAAVGEGGIEQALDLVDPIRRGVDQEEIVSFLTRIEAQEVRLGHQQFALKNAVLQQADDAQLHQLAAFVRHLDDPAERCS